MKSLIFIFLALLCLCFKSISQDTEFEQFYTNWFKAYHELNIPATSLDYNENFANIGGASDLKVQRSFFLDKKNLLEKFKETNLSEDNRIKLTQIKFETTQHLERIKLENKWIKEGRKIPVGGLHNLTNYKDWYSYYVRHFTGLTITPEEVYKIGEVEVSKAQQQLLKISSELGFKSLTDLIAETKKPDYYITDKNTILRGFASIDSIVRSKMHTCFRPYEVPPVEAMEWPGAVASTPPGMYLSKDDNPFNADVFQFNFYSGKYNKRCMEWLYMHEAIPGHHLQHCISGRRTGIFYFGTTEGWACYIEDLGQELGLYNTAFSRLGKEEWNLVRSARLVMEVGIHYYGWTYEDAKNYWQKNIVGQDEIADREINRISKWPGQALCYKVGALSIRKIIESKLKAGLNLADCHHFFLTHSAYPLEALLAKEI